MVIVLVVKSASRSEWSWPRLLQPANVLQGETIGAMCATGRICSSRFRSRRQGLGYVPGNYERLPGFLWLYTRGRAMKVCDQLSSRQVNVDIVR